MDQDGDGPSSFCMPNLTCQALNPVALEKECRSCHAVLDTCLRIVSGETFQHQVAGFLRSSDLACLKQMLMLYRAPHGMPKSVVKTNTGGGTASSRYRLRSSAEGTAMARKVSWTPLTFSFQRL